MRDDFMDSFIEIELFQDTAFYYNEPLHGTIHINAKNNLNDVNKITLSLDGFEHSRIFKPGKNVPETSIEAILNHKFDVYDYKDYHNVITYGAYAFPFTIWLPQIIP